MKLPIAFEIVLIDDASAPSFQSQYIELSLLPYLRLNRLQHNIGRAAIRNRLAREAQYPFLLFLDGDMTVVRDEFLAAYWLRRTEGGVTVGGLSYAKRVPDDPALRLHWFIGSQREVRSVVERRHRPYHSFLSSSFLIDAGIFDRLRFDERLSGYGHEDTRFGLELERLGIPIDHIDNPIRHDGLEPANVFLLKSRHAIENLNRLLDLLDDRAAARLVERIKLLRYARPLLASRWLRSAFLHIYRQWKPKIVDRLTGPSPTLRDFDVYKLGELLSAFDDRTIRDHQTSSSKK